DRLHDRLVYRVAYLVVDHALGHVAAEDDHHSSELARRQGLAQESNRPLDHPIKAPLGNLGAVLVDSVDLVGEYHLAKVQIRQHQGRHAMDQLAAAWRSACPCRSVRKDAGVDPADDPLYCGEISRHLAKLL